jgi:hypothetical protein
VSFIWVKPAPIFLEFESLVVTFRPVLQKYQGTRKKKRKRAVGGGRKHTLKIAAERLFFILFYVKCYPTMDLAGFLFGVDRSRIQRWVKELLPLLIQAQILEANGAQVAEWWLFVGYKSSQY